MKFSDLIIPLIICAVLVYGLIKRVDVFGEFLIGAKENLKTAVEILPALIALMTCVSMLNVSGLLEMVTDILSPVTSLLGFPAQCVPLAVMRPISGSGAMAMLENILSENHPDSFIGRVACVLMGSTETTFYTMAVYYGAAGIKKTRHTLPCALTADFTGFLASVLTVRILF